MSKSLKSFIDEPEIPGIKKFFFSLTREEEKILLRNRILQLFGQFIESEGVSGRLSSSWRFIRKVQEIIREGERLIMVFRHRRASCRIYALNGKDDGLEQLAVRDFLYIKTALLRPDIPPGHRTLEVNLAPFYDYGPNLRDPHTIGHGIKHLNRYMSANLSNQPERWTRALYEFLKLHHLHGVQLLLDGNMIRSTAGLENAIEDGIDYLERAADDDDPLDVVRARLKAFGFLDGWGDSRERIMETFHLLQDTLEQPSEEALEEFLSRIPMVSKVVMVSVHGWFGQENVLGRPDTGGQVVYVLNQARALERYLEEDLRRSGLGISTKIIIVTRLIPENEGTCSDQRLEKVRGSKNVWILRVPFVDGHGRVLPQWISRFSVWPYLEEFAVAAEKEIRAELSGRPDLIIGNYTDGNLVATQLSRMMGVIQCNIAHALEKSKYLFSDLYWQDFEEEYHFSMQFMADLIAMNQANFIITSTSQEIIGSDHAIGQYESYQFFTMPGLMQVISGINLFHPRFNVIPPGVNNEVFFPFTESERRLPKSHQEELARELFETCGPDSLGELKNPDLPPIFTIARLDRIKNLTGLVEAYGKSERLRGLANIILVASVIDPSRSKDAEEKAEINRMHELINTYDLGGHIRWIGRILGNEEAGEAYRIMADRCGMFVQPALFEAFGLTILEAMHSGLPVLATQFGGPHEIIEHGVSGFLINPTDHETMVARIAEFLENCTAAPEYWQGFSERGLARARKRFTWDLHCRDLTRLTKVYGFWRYSISHDAKSRLSQYCHLLYQLFFQTRAEKIKIGGGGS